MLFLRYYLWIVPDLLCGVGLVVAVRKKVHTRLPAFVTLLAFNFACELFVSFTLAAFFPQSTYRWWLILDVAAWFVLELLVLFEVAREVLFSHSSLNRLFHSLPRWTAAVLVLAAAVLAALIPQTAHEYATNLFHTLIFVLNLISIGLLLAMLLLTRILGVSWRGVPAGIALGFGVVAATEMAASTLMAQLGKSSYIPVDVVRMIAFHICVLVWLIYLLLPERQAQPGELPDVEVHIQELQRMVRQ